MQEVYFMGEEGIAFWAHIGGFVAGLVLVRWFDPAPRRRPPWR